MPPVRPKSTAFWNSMASSRSLACMRPSTGPKTSVRWKKEPGLTPSLIPGLHRRPESSSCLGSSSQDSPGSSVVSARRSLSDGSSVSGPMVDARFEGQSTTIDEAASTSWRR